MPFIRFADQVQHAPLLRFGPRRLYDHLLLLCLAGEGEVILDGLAYASRPETLFLVPPRILNEYRTGAKERQIYLGIHFDWSIQPDSVAFPVYRPAEEPFEESLFRERREVPNWNWEASPSLDLRGRPRVGQLLHEVVTAYHVGDALARRQAGAFLAAALLQIEREARYLGDLKQNPQLGADAVRRAHRAREVLENASRTSVALAAAEVGWTPDHLNRVCRVVFGVSPQQLRTKARLRRAQELLGYGNASVSEVAFACGYADVSHFIRMFRAETGLTPHQFATMDRRAESTVEFERTM